MRGLVAVAVVLTFAEPARADVGGSAAPNWWLAWNTDPVLLLNFLFVSHLYARGMKRLWRSGPGRGVTAWQVAAFAGGIFTLVAALVSPLDALAPTRVGTHGAAHAADDRRGAAARPRKPGCRDPVRRAGTVPRCAWPRVAASRW